MFSFLTWQDTSFKGEDREQLRKDLALNGAIVSATINHRVSFHSSSHTKVTHLICEIEDYETIDLAQEFGLR